MNEYEVRLVSSLEKILPNNDSLRESPITRLSGYRGQRVSFQAAYRFNGVHFLDQTLEQGTINPSVKITAAGPLASAVRLRRVDCVPVMNPCGNRYDENYLTYQAGMLPDILAEFDGWVQFIPRQWRAIWVDVELPENAAAGDYKLELVFTDMSDRVLQRSCLTLHIVPAELPEQTLLHTEWLYPDCIADYYKIEVFSERHWQIVENFIGLAVKRGVNMLLTPVFTPALDTLIGKNRRTVQLVDITYEGGVYRFGWDNLKRWISIAKKAGIRYFEISHLFTQWGAKFAPKVMVTQDGKSELRFGWHTPALSSGYRELLEALLPELTHQLELAGIADCTYFHISDEPTTGNADTYRAAKNMVLPWLQGYPILDALSHIELYNDGTVERPVPMSDAVHPFLDAGMEHPWVYHCCAQSVDVANRFLAMPSCRNRILGVQLYKYNMEGFLHWGFNFYNSQYSIEPIDPYTTNDAVDTFPAGDPFIVYPGKDGYPVESLRLVVLQDALNDVRALRLLEKLAGRQYVLSLIDTETEAPITFSSYPCYPSYLTGLWERVAAEIEKRL